MNNKSEFDRHMANYNGMNIRELIDELVRVDIETRKLGLQRTVIIVKMAQIKGRAQLYKGLDGE